MNKWFILKSVRYFYSEHIDFTCENEFWPNFLFLDLFCYRCLLFLAIFLDKLLLLYTNLCYIYAETELEALPCLTFFSENIDIYVKSSP